jgi:hypothetical protein
MSGPSYPSPISSAVSPDITSASPVATVPTVPGVTNRHDPIDTQRSLHQASAALEAAYNRIRQVRRNLLELSETLPASQRRASGPNDIGPEHEAITLTEALVDASAPPDEDFRSQPVQSMHSLMGRLRRYERLLGLEDGHGRDSDTPISSTSALPPRAPSQSSSVPSPLSPQRSNHPPRRTQLENHFSRRRDANSDDASTSIGRRVAAREAAGFTPARTFSRFALVERELEDLRLSLRQRRTEPQRLDTLVEHRREERVAQIESRINSLTAPSNNASPTRPRLDSRPRPEPRRRLAESTYSQSPTSISTYSERLSLLSNLSVQNLATPGSASIARPLLFDEPSSYIPAANFAPLSEPRAAGEDRNYVVRRRMNADGEEHIHPINLDWSDEEMTWMIPRDLQDETSYDPPPTSSRPSRASARYHPRRDTIQSTQTPLGRQRRRGWGTWLLIMRTITVKINPKSLV